jgi:hypothetical protein
MTGFFNLQSIRVIIMRKTFAAIVFLLVVASLIALIGCNQAKDGNKPDTLFNESLNQQIENLTNTSLPDVFEEFYFNYTPRNDSMYELARDDVFTMTMGNFNSTQLSFLGVMLGDSYDKVLELLGTPDLESRAADGSYRNLEYGKKIGIGEEEAGLVIHIDDSTVTRITVTKSFNKYLHGNTTLGQPKELVYALFDTPDYQSVVSNMKVFHYVEKGTEIYFDARNVDRMSFINPHDFKGVKYVTVQTEIANGVFVNSTVPVEIE